jgi:hypothetical protein
MYSNIIDFMFFKRFNIIFIIEKDEIKFLLKDGIRNAKEKKHFLHKVNKRKNSPSTEKVIPLLKE